MSALRDEQPVRVVTASFRASAEHYLHQWCGYDREFVDGFAHTPLTIDLVTKMCDRYSVARIVPGYAAEDPNKYKRFAKMLEKYRDARVTRESLPGVIQAALEEMKDAYGKNLLSAITKAFWMLKGHPVVIYDSHARLGLLKCGLAPGNGDYSLFVRSWFKFFESPHVQRALDDALAWLLECPCAALLMRKKELRELYKSARFRNRVVDIALFLRGTESPTAPIFIEAVGSHRVCAVPLAPLYKATGC